MKKLILITLLFTGCSNEHDSPLIVTSVRLSNKPNIYIVDINNDLSPIVTDHKYSIGDTIK